MTASHLIDYQQVTNAYWENLNTVLRGFQPAEDFLELWVPDEDHIKSIVSMIESVQVTGHDKLALFLHDEILKQLNVDSLREAAARYGTVSLERREDGMTLEVTLKA